MIVALAACHLVVDFTDPDGGSVDSRPTADSAPTPPGDSAESGDSGPGPTDSGTVPGLEVSIVGDAAGDRIGEVGVWALGDPDGDGSGALVIGKDGGLALFSGAALAPDTPWSAAETRWTRSGVGWAFADLGDRHVIGDRGSGTVWVVPVSPGGEADPSDLALDTVSPDGGGEEGRLGDALAAGDWDGDGVRDLAIGDPTSRGGDGQLYVQLGPVGGSSADTSLRGTSGGLGAALAMGPLDGGGADGVVGCESGGNGRCWLLPAGGSEQDTDVDESGAPAILGTSAAPIGQLDPRLVDVDGDGAVDLVIPGDTAAAWFLAPLPTGSIGVDGADRLVTGEAVGGATGADGVLVVGAPQVGAGAVFSLAASGAIADGAALWTGAAAGDSLGARVSDPAVLVGPGQIAVSAPGAARTAGVVYVRAP